MRIGTIFKNPPLRAVADANCSRVGTEEEEKEAGRCDKYFEDPELLARVPGMFLLLGGIYMAAGLIATVMVHEPGGWCVPAEVGTFGIFLIFSMKKNDFCIFP